MTRTAWVALAVLVALVVSCVVGPWIMKGDPVAIGDVLGARYLPPGARDPPGSLHLLGTDRFGRDLLARMLLAGRVSLAVGVAGSVLAAVIGTAIGALAGWRGGWLDRIAMSVSDVLLAVPRIVLLLVCAALWEPGLGLVVVVLVAT